MKVKELKAIIDQLDDEQEVVFQHIKKEDSHKEDVKVNYWDIPDASEILYESHIQFIEKYNKEVQEVLELINSSKNEGKTKISYNATNEEILIGLRKVFEQKGFKTSSVIILNDKYDLTLTW